MAPSRRPEQRSTHSTPRSGVSPKPTGNEVYDPVTPARPSGPSELPDSPTPVTEAEEAAVGLYGQLADAANQVTQQAQAVLSTARAYVKSHPNPFLGGAFALGLVVGLLTGRD